MEASSLTLSAAGSAILGFLTSFGIKLLAAIIVLVVGIKLAGWIVKKLGKSKGFERLDTSVGHFLLSAVKILLYIVIVITAAGIIGIPATSFITVLASAGVAIGLALQGSLANIAGSIMILFFRPFKIGDYIEGNGVSGTVEDINLFYTVINTPDNKTITCPNGALSNGNIINYSTKDTRRVDLTFSVAYDSDIEKVKGIILAIINSEECVIKELEPFVALSAHNESSLDFVVRAWCKSADYWTLYFDLLEKVKKAFDVAGIEIPYPQMDVHVKKDR